MVHVRESNEQRKLYLGLQNVVVNGGVVYLLLDESDCLAGVETFRASLGAVHDCVATVQLEGVIQSCRIAGVK